MANTSWMTQNWIVGSITPYVSNFSPGVATTDIVVFDLTQQKIFRTPVIPQNLVNSSVSITGATPWGTWNQAFPNGVRGVTSSGNEPFTITWDGANQLTCELWASPPTRPWRAIAIGTLFGAFVGAITGRAAGNLRLGLLTGATAGVASSFATAAATIEGAVQTGSSGTWVANDGSSGGGTGTVGKPGDGGQNQDPHAARPARVA